jgi:Uma2 family endonuclease
MGGFLSMVTAKPELAQSWPDHTQLPESDGTFVKNFQEHPQSLLLTSSIAPVLDALHPDGKYAIGQDCGIYWRLVEPPEQGAEAPDWFYVPNVPPLLKGKNRRSYVLWKELVPPLIALEFVSGDGTEERDATDPSESATAKAGKFWVYEQAVKIPFYGIYDVERANVELYRLVNHKYQRCIANDRGHYPIPELGVELGIWRGEFLNQEFPWLRWWDYRGNLLLAGEERADRANLLVAEEKQRADRANLLVAEEKQRADEEKQRADGEKRRADRLAAKLRGLGIEPDD